MPLGELFSAHEGLRVLFGLCHQLAWEFDLKTRLFTLFGDTARLAGDTLENPFSADDLTNSGFIHHDSVPSFKRFLQTLLEGSERGETFLMLRLSGSTTFAWFNLSYQTIKNEEGLPCRAVGTLERVNDIHRNNLVLIEAIKSVNSENYASMGALAAAVPGLLALENERGPKYCNDILTFLREQLEHCFVRDIVLSPHDQEFFVLCPNSSRESFFDRVTQLRQLCEERYAGKIELGASWSDGAFTGPELFNEARAVILSHSGTLQQNAEIVRAPRILDAHVPVNQFTVFYQPKVDMQSKRIIGAEALVRGVGDKGDIQPPGRFINILEHEGQLRTLDLFVFSRVLQQLAQWKRMGRKLVPVSLNFSRYTLFDKSTFGTVQALLRNYDEVDPSLIEIEISTTACSVDPETLNETMKPYEEQGIRFALDDFGTGSVDLSLLSNVRFSTIKLDQAFIKDLPGSVKAASLVDSVVRIGEQSKALVVAEGVDEDKLADNLMQHGCRFAQGYFYEKPLDPKEFTQKYLAGGGGPRFGVKQESQERSLRLGERLESEERCCKRQR